MDSITSSRELKIATRGGDVTAVVLSPLHTGHAQRVGASRGPYAAREKQGEELRRAAALRESRPCTREAQPHCTSRRAVAILNQMRHRSSRFDDAPTAVPQQDDGPRRGPLSRTKNISYSSYINYCVRTVLR